MSGAGKEDFNFDKMYEELKSAELKKAEATIDDLRGDLALKVAEVEKLEGKSNILLADLSNQKEYIKKRNAEPVKWREEKDNLNKFRYKISKMVSSTGHRLNSWDQNLKDIQKLTTENEQLKQEKAKLIKWLVDQVVRRVDSKFSNDQAAAYHYQFVLDKIEELKGGGE